MAHTVRARIKIYSNALEATAGCDGFEVAFSGIDIPYLNDRYTTPWHPHRMAIDFMAQALNGTATGRNTHFLAIADEIDQADTLRARRRPSRPRSRICSGRTADGSPKNTF